MRLAGTPFAADENGWGPFPRRERLQVPLHFVANVSVADRQAINPYGGDDACAKTPDKRPRRSHDSLVDRSVAILVRYLSISTSSTGEYVWP